MNQKRLLYTKDTKICLWGAGWFGTVLKKRLFDKFNISVDFFCDNNSSIWGTKKNGILCISPEIMKEVEHIVCIVSVVDSEQQSKICEQLDSLGVDYLRYGIELVDFFQKKLYTFELTPELPLNSSQDKVVIYTAMTGNYDIVHPSYILEDNVEFYYICEKELPGMGNAVWMNINDLDVPPYLDDTRRARYCKLHPHKFFPKARYSVWIDANMWINEKITWIIHSLKKTGISTYVHSQRDCIYEEGLACWLEHRDEETVIFRQLERYHSEGMPQHFGLYETRIMVREHNNSYCRQLMEEWWNEVLNESKRDQISLPYILWKNGYAYTDVGLLGIKSYKGDFVVIEKHAVKI